MPLENRWRHHLEQLRAEGRYRSLRPAAGIDFSSNDYLGFGKIPWPQTEALPASGTASRLLRGQHPLWEEVEARLAQWHGAEAALVFTTGYAANEGLLATLLEPDDTVFSDQANHASIIDGVRLTRARRVVYRHNDLSHLEDALREARPGRQTFIVTESLFGMDGDRAPLLGLVDLAERHGAALIVDEAHATGCFGARGGGLVDELGLRPRVLATVHTGGKALGVPGAYTACGGLLREYLINRCRHFIFTTALPPAVAAWWRDAIERVQRADEPRRRLHANAQLFRGILVQRGITCPGADFIAPVVFGADQRAAAAATALETQGYDVRAIRPPTVPAGSARLRVSIHADHERETIERVADALSREMEKAAG
ncbi:MAG: 8-amino-7-oxononanoate synthase [Gemmataceae bacterium]